MTRRMAAKLAAALIGGAMLTGCQSGPAVSDPVDATVGDTGIDRTGAHPATALAEAPFAVAEVAQFSSPWAMALLPGSDAALITEKTGQLMLWRPGAAPVPVTGVPAAAVGGQGGLGDIISLGRARSPGEYPVALSWADTGDGGLGAVVATATLRLGPVPRLGELTIIWQQSPMVSGRGHFGHRLALAPDGRHLFISSGDRQKLDPAQDMASNLGKIVRVRLDGTVPTDNPFAAAGGVSAQIWSLGHRNPLGLVFDGKGRLWSHEMGPRHGDELHRVQPRANYGWPIASNGDHYDGRAIPDHREKPEFTAPDLWWNPAISPAGLAYHDGRGFVGWGPSLLMGGLSGQALIRINIAGDRASKAERWDMGARIREVETAPDGGIWVLTDGDRGKLLKLTPRQAGR